MLTGQHHGVGPGFAACVGHLDPVKGVHALATRADHDGAVETVQGDEKLTSRAVAGFELVPTTLFDWPS